MHGLFPMLLLAATVCVAAGEPPADQKGTANTACITQCDVAEARCSSEVRRARQECSKRAAASGRDPLSMRNNDYGYFCGYFNQAAACARGTYTRGCQDRFTRRYGLCVDAINNNIAAMRHDCYLNERDAQAFCRDELRDCKEACGMQ